ncbi:septum formation initiator [Clostridium carboxidivorans P7]|uniref:Amino acid transporter transmembrane n=1 Tax=Clostridium carboxidivorans P7 TaxID=536227 RepID=C6PZL4_9CLOT|nr:aromatic amino acid transport family protein [Clostridium carboxidivorans]AKN31877.1 septum formation initiator [Clostridium carboxidivorans P7]EET85326.1 Amino acid transporter transmembrane [Clostridium carboxidivorans P7]
MIQEKFQETKEYKNANKWHSQDTTWAMSLFGTAIGAGVLFLPINAGAGGILSLLLITIIAFPIMYFSHRAMAKMIYFSKSGDKGITATVREYFGNTASKVFDVVYFFSIYSILIMYAVSLTNTAKSFIENQLKMQAPPRIVLSLVLVLFLIFIVNFGQDVTVKVMSYLVYPFIATLVLLSLYLIPQWSVSNLSLAGNFAPAGGKVGITTVLGIAWFILPIIVFSFNHSPMISTFVVKQRETYGMENVDRKCAQIQKVCYTVTICVVLFFVFSTVLSVTSADLALAKKENLPVLSFLANKYKMPLFAYGAPIIALVAITKSFLGHYIGAYEGLEDIIVQGAKSCGKDLNGKTVKNIIVVFMILTCWMIAFLDPSILDLIDMVNAPLIAMILFLLPMYAIYKVPTLSKYKKNLSNIFVIVVGLLVVLSSIKAFF